MQKKLEANLSTLILSLGSSSLMNLGLAPHPETGQTQKNVEVAKFNIDMLVMLQQKTKGNLSQEEERFLGNIVTDLRLKFVEVSKQ